MVMQMQTANRNTNKMFLMLVVTVNEICTKSKNRWNDDNVSNADGDSQRKMSAFEDAAA